MIYDQNFKQTDKQHTKRRGMGYNRRCSRRSDEHNKKTHIYRQFLRFLAEKFSRFFF